MKLPFSSTSSFARSLSSATKILTPPAPASGKNGKLVRRSGTRLLDGSLLPAANTSNSLLSLSQNSSPSGLRRSATERLRRLMRRKSSSSETLPLAGGVSPLSALSPSPSVSSAPARLCLPSRKAVLFDTSPNNSTSGTLARLAPQRELLAELGPGKFSDAENAVIAQTLHKRLQSLDLLDQPVNLLVYSSGGSRDTAFISACLADAGVKLGHISLIDPTCPRTGTRPPYQRLVEAKWVDEFSVHALGLRLRRSLELKPRTFHAIVDLQSGRHGVNALIDPLEGRGASLPCFQFSREAAQPNRILVEQNMSPPAMEQRKPASLAGSTGSDSDSDEPGAIAKLRVPRPLLSRVGTHPAYNTPSSGLSRPLKLPEQLERTGHRPVSLRNPFEDHSSDPVSAQAASDMDTDLSANFDF